MKWVINIDNFQGGFAPAWYKETYPSYGNKNQAGAMLNVDLTNPGYLTQGPGLANLTNGTQAAAVTTLIKGMTDFAVTSDAAYGTGGAKLYKFSSTAVTNAGDWPHTIDKGAVTGELGEDVALYQGNLYYSYTHSGSGGDIGKFDLTSTFDDDWGSTVPTGAAALNDSPHPLEVGGNDTMYFANGRYVGSYDGTTYDTAALDLPTGAVVQDIKWNADRLWILANKTNITGTNKNLASLYVWDGSADSWEVEIPLMGKASALHRKNGVIFLFYQDISSSGGYKMAYASNGGVTDVANFTGGLPSYYQVTDYKDFIIWDAGGLIFAFGSGDTHLPTKLFQLADSGYSTAGGLATPFGTPIVASTESTNYKLAQFSGYDITGNWKSLMFDVTGENRLSKVERVKINFEVLTTNTRTDWKLLDNQGRTLYSDTISYAKLGAVTKKDYPIGKLTENFRVEFDFANANATNNIKIKNVRIYGTTE